MKHLESNLQTACMNWARLQYPKLLIWHCPNGGSRNIKEAARLKREGVLAGVSDIHVDKACGQWHGLKIEMKAGQGKLTDAQRAYLQTVKNEGYATAVCYTFEEFQEVLTKYLKGEW